MRAGSVIVMISAATLVTVGGSLLVDSWRKANDLDGVKSARPVALRVDLSKAGTYSAGFQQTYSGSHFQMLVWEMESNQSAESPTQDLLAGLTGQIRILDANGCNIVEEAISCEHGLFDGVAERALASFPPPKKGAYRFELDITSPSAHAPARPQMLTQRYRLCGMEYFAGAVSGVLGCSAIAVAAIVALVFLVWRARRRRRRAAEVA